MKIWLVRLSAASVLALTGCSLQPNDYTLPGQVAVGGDGYSVTVTFNQVANLVPNSAVELNDVVVGTVASIREVDWHAQVRLRLLKSAKIPTDATFSIGQKTLLGAQYVEVVEPSTDGVGSSVPLRNGSHIPASRTGTYPATEQVLGAVALLLNNGGLSQIDTISSQLAAAFSGSHLPDTRELIRRTNTLLAALNANKANIVHALASLNTLTSGLAEDHTVLGRAIDQLGPGLMSLERERRTLVNAIKATGVTGSQASRVIHATRPDLLEIVNSLNPILANLKGVASVIPDALKVGLTIPFPLMTSMKAIRGDFANAFTTLDLRGSTFANTWLAGLLLGTPTTPNAQSAGTGTSRGSKAQTSSAPGVPGSSNAGVTAGSSGGCLLALLGLCP